MTTDAEDRSTWPPNRQRIRRDELLRLIEDNGGPDGLDLRGAVLASDEPTLDGGPRPVDLSPEALAPLAQAYRQANGGANPPWLEPTGGMALDHALGDGALLLFAHLQRADLHDARLQNSNLSWADLEGANLSRAWLQDAYLEGASLVDADLSWVQLQGADVSGAALEHARLVEASLQAADLDDADLEGADLQGADLRQASLDGASLRGGNLSQAHLQGTDLYHVISLERAHWYGAHLDHTRIKQESLGKRTGEEFKAHDSKEAEHYHYAKEAYLLLKNNFNQIGRYEDASWAYVKEQQMEKMALYWDWRTRGSPGHWEERSHTWQFWRSWGPFGRWLLNWAYELLTGYGERPLNAVGAGLVAILAFGVGFWASGVGGGRGALAFLDCLVYSIATFATFNLARPDLNPTGRGIEIASSLEAILGISVLALVVFTVGNRMSRS